VIGMTIVVGYIPTAEGERALDAALEEARLRGTRLVVVNATRRDTYIDGRYVQEEDWQALQDRLALADVPCTVVRPDSHHDAATVLVDAAHEYDAQLVVIGLRRRSAVGKLLMGSTAQRVLLQAPCSVLAARA
jgi:nucleotide-binding universal stress UspA family protein